jgi:Spy/CpxP family protein refolding chaperone
VRVALALIGLAMWAGTVHAAPPEPAQDRARTYLMMRLVDGLNLPDDKALALRAIFRKADERRVELTAKRQALDKKLRAVLARPDKDSAELAHLVAETNDVDRELASVAEDSFAEAQKSLTVEQQAKLLLLRRELQGQVREAMRRRLGQRGGHGRPQPKTNHR